MQEMQIGAVDIGGTKIAVGIVDGRGNLLEEDCFPTNTEQQSPEEAMEQVLRLLRKQCDKRDILFENLKGIGISCAGPVNVQEGIVDNPFTLPGWEGFRLVDYLRDKSKLPIRLENDANGALLGEVFQRGLENRRVLMVTIGTGIGVAFWEGGKLFSHKKYHQEMGHIVVSGEKRSCYCGHEGCFESCCSGTALNARAVEAGYEDFDDMYNAAVQKKEVKAEKLLHIISKNMANGIWTLNIVFKPEVIILAGGFTRKYFEYFKQVILTDSRGKEEFLDDFLILPTSNNANPALVGAKMLF